jgi:uncharacterized membrane protein (UPF0127 family)
MVNGMQDHLVYVYNKTRETFVGTEVTVANTYLRRLVGLLGKTRRWAQSGRGLWIVPCHGVHTIGMMFPIDLVFLNKEKQVVRVEEHLRPFRISSVSLRACSVLELPAHTIYRTGTREGDTLEIAWLRNTATAGNLISLRRTEAENGRAVGRPSAPAQRHGKKPADNSPAALDKAV